MVTHNLHTSVFCSITAVFSSSVLDMEIRSPSESVDKEIPEVSHALTAPYSQVLKTPVSTKTALPDRLCCCHNCSMKDLLPLCLKQYSKVTCERTPPPFMMFFGSFCTDYCPPKLRAALTTYMVA
jgi:hypothetical protein